MSFFFFFVQYVHDGFDFFFQAEDGIRDATVTGVQTWLFRSATGRFSPYCLRPFSCRIWDQLRTPVKTQEIRNLPRRALQRIRTARMPHPQVLMPWPGRIRISGKSELPESSLESVKVLVGAACTSPPPESAEL